MNRCIRAIIYGHVQGVYFRYHTRKEATRLNLTGWVANRIDGTVEVVAEGPENALREMIRFLHQGSPGARVERVEVTWQATSGEFNEFSVIRL
ncbi:MAG: acylphosphatase [Candidatus Promineifilaceae bacterium]|nr:acylphosphatase [Candidatus Promineifilaceae bacterium]